RAIIKAHLELIKRLREHGDAAGVKSRRPDGSVTRRSLLKARDVRVPIDADGRLQTGVARLRAGKFVHLIARRSSSYIPGRGIGRERDVCRVTGTGRALLQGCNDRIGPVGV